MFRCQNAIVKILITALQHNTTQKPHIHTQNQSKHFIGHKMRNDCICVEKKQGALSSFLYFRYGERDHLGMD